MIIKAYTRKAETGGRPGPRRCGAVMKAVISVLVLLYPAVIPSGALHAQDTRGYEWFWVFYEKDHDKRISTVVYRPFFMRNAYASGKTFEASLMPLVYWKYGSAHGSEWKSLFGFVDSVDYRHGNGVQDYDFGIFPLLFYGNSTDVRDRYFMLLPFGGTVKGKLAQEHITAWVFPGFLLFFLYPPGLNLTTLAVLAASLIPVWVDYGAKDYTAWGILWPLIQRGTSPSRDDFRILPFYAHNYKKDVYDNYSFLMLANFQNVYLKNDVQRTVFILPFYGRRWNESGVAGSSTLLWPFFSWGFNRKAGDFELNFPWPLVMIQDCKNPYIYKRIYFPFYGNYIYEKKETFFITPLYFSMKDTTRALTAEYYFNALIVWYFKREYHGKPDAYYGKSWRYFKVWPLLQYEHDDRGNSNFNMLSLLPFRDPDGYEMLYQPLWTLFEYRTLAGGEKRMGIALRLYYQAWSGDFFYAKIPFLFTYREDKDVLTKISFLFSMFGYSRDGRGSRLRLFWIPISLGGSAPPEKTEPGSPPARAEREPDEPELPVELSLIQPGAAATEDGRTTLNSLHYSIRAF